MKKVLKIWKEDFLFHSMFLGGLLGGLAMATLNYALGKSFLATLTGVGIGLILVVSLYTIISLVIQKND